MSNSESYQQPKSPLYILLLLLIAKIAIQYWVVDSSYDLHRDEYLHLDMANHLAGGYVSVPPLISWNSVLIQWLGNSVFWVRFFPALYGALTMLFMWKMIEMVGGGVFAQLLAGLTFLCSGMTRLNMFYQPNSVDVLTWTIIFWLLIKYIRRPKDTYLIWMGIIIGIGILNKYNIVFLVLGLFAGLLFTDYRTIYKKGAFYTAILLALVIASPNIYWQIKHGLPVIHHMQELSRTQLVNNSRIGFITDQFIFFIGGAFLILASIISIAVYKPFRPYRIVLIIYLATIALFVFFRAKNYYAVGLYPVLLAFGSTWWEQLFKRFTYIRWLWLALIVIPFFVLFYAIFPVLKPQEIAAVSSKFKSLGILRWEDGKDHAIPQDFADMLGWHEIAGLVQKAWSQIPEKEKKHTLILCDNYGQAGAVNFYSKGSVPTAVAEEADYVFWFPNLDSVHYIIKVGDAPDSDYTNLIRNVQAIGGPADTLCRERQWGTQVFILSEISPLFSGTFVPQLEETKKKYMPY